MKAAFKEKWLTALRGSEYQQTINVLQDDRGFCCLGVLLDVSGMGEWFAGDYYMDRDDENRELICDGELGVARLEFGLPQAEEMTLIRMNDEQGKTFAEIADYIEKNL